VVWPSHHRLAKCRVVCPNLRPRKNKCRVDIDLEKINVEWSGPLTTVSPNVEWCAQNNYYDLEKINVERITTSEKLMLSGLAL
jgi:hypothetical protein